MTKHATRDSATALLQNMRDFLAQSRWVWLYGSWAGHVTLENEVVNINLSQTGLDWTSEYANAFCLAGIARHIGWLFLLNEHPDEVELLKQKLVPPFCTDDQKSGIAKQHWYDEDILYKMTVRRLNFAIAKFQEKRGERVHFYDGVYHDSALAFLRNAPALHSLDSLIVNFNDAEGRKYEDIVEVVRSAIEDEDIMLLAEGAMLVDEGAHT